MAKRRDTCSSCTEPFNGSTRTEVSCGFCGYRVCAECAKTYLLSKPLPVHCMNCKKAWNHMFLDQVFSKAFMNGDLKRHIGQKLFERELELMAESQTFVDHRRQLDSWREKIDANNRRIKELMEENHSLRKTIQSHTTTSDIIMKCPQPSCLGFVSDKYTCGVCLSSFCQRCHSLSQPGHACRPEDEASVAEIRRETKPCPSCKAPISKSDGCNQMWCTNCRHGFDWSSLGILGIVHNPHYQQYLETLRPAREPVCERIPADVFLGHLRLNVPAHSETCMSIYRLVAHWKETELPDLPTPNDTVCNRDLRISYLTGELKEDKFKETLQRRFKEREKKLEYREIIEAYVAVGEDLISHMARTVDVEPLIAEEKRVRTYLNKQITELGKRYDASFRTIKR
jgi:hypothetical protein